MKRYLFGVCGAAIIAWSLWARAVEPKPEDVVKKMLQTYRTAKTYSENATESLKFKGGGREVTQTFTHRFHYEAPNKFYYDMKADGHLMEAVASDGKTVSGFSARTGKVQKKDAPAKMTEMKSTLAGFDLMTQSDPFAFLVGEEPLEKGTKAKLVKTDTIAGKSVYQIDLTQSDGQKKTFWIGKDDSLLYRLQQTVSQTQGGVTIPIDVTETHSDMKVNGKLPADAFTIKTPQ